MVEEKIRFQTPREARLKTALRELAEKSEGYIRAIADDAGGNTVIRRGTWLLKAIAKANAVLEKDM